MPLLQWADYEDLDFESALAKPAHRLINAYIIRKSLIRKHYLSTTILHWCTKHPTSPLKQHFRAAVDFELDYAEFLDDALMEADAFDLTASMERNADLAKVGREYWILKPGMSDRGQGIRLFSTMDELQGIFEGWEEESGISEAADDEDGAGPRDEVGNGTVGEGILTSHLRHFLAQPYIHPPLLLPRAPYNNRKFHIRTYIVAAGALRVYVYQHMLALFASHPYAAPWETDDETSSLAPGPAESGPLTSATSRETEQVALLHQMRNIHLTNTCVQSGDAKDSVFLLSDLPLPKPTHAAITLQIHTIISELFRAALAQPTNFQPLPQGFEIYGVDFLVEDTSAVTGQALNESQITVNVQLLEVNAFPDFAQTGDVLRDVVVKGLFEEVVRVVVGPYFGVALDKQFPQVGEAEERLIKVLDINQHLC